MNEAIKNSDLTYRLARAKEWIRIHGRRLIHSIHRGVAGLRRGHQGGGRRHGYLRGL